MSFFSVVSDLLTPAPPPDPRVVAALEKVNTLVSPILQSAAGFEQRLSGPLEHAIGYCDGLVAALPGPIDLNRQAFARDPLVHALFATADDIDQMLGRSQAVRDFLSQPASWESPYFYALFAARRQQKKQLGMASQGEVIQMDVPQLVIYFSNHTLIEPAVDLEETRERLRVAALESLLKAFHEHVEALRSERDGLRSDLSVQRAHLNVLRSGVDGAPCEVCSRHIDALDQRLHATADALMPEQLVDALGEFLRSPEPSLHIQPVSVTVDRLGVVRQDDADGMTTHTLDFPELSTRDKRMHTVLLARIHRDEALEAVERVRDQQHRFMLI